MKQDTRSSVDVALLGDLFWAYILEFLKPCTAAFGFAMPVCTLTDVHEF